MALELHDQHLYVHVLNTEDPAAVLGEIRRMERYIMDMFGDEAVTTTDE